MAATSMSTAERRRGERRRRRRTRGDSDAEYYSSAASVPPVPELLLLLLSAAFVAAAVAMASPGGCSAPTFAVSAFAPRGGIPVLRDRRRRRRRAAASPSASSSSPTFGLSGVTSSDAAEGDREGAAAADQSISSSPSDPSSSSASLMMPFPSSASPMMSASASASSAVVDAVSSHVASSSSLLGIKSIGVDFGLARTGLAVTIGYSPHPLAIASGMNETALVGEVMRLAESEGATRAVVGLPLHKNGTESERSGLTRTFASKLAAGAYGHFGPRFRVDMWDERYSSKMAAAKAVAASRRRGGEDPGRMDLYGSLDADAACLILEHYYAEGGEDAETVRVPDDARDSAERAWEKRMEEREEARKMTQERRREGLDARRMAMERAARMEEAMAERGELGATNRNKKGKKKKKNRARTSLCFGI
uniref:YqgF/RNase H-like domain-containing protein n=1 Tax=Odontella aurita TaxID=265563 RepID=A0A7S4MY71_9STRA|mmetsp:Transcript_38353/g.114825  ORF Transcript_38353/g.114825 Transcript_38353/m.114825 type:complete len:422 (+) Transcript_38353:80-1345(+)